MKKKLLAVVLSVVMLAALFVPMMAISAEGAPTAKISLGTPFITERDYDEDGTAEATILGVPVILSENDGAMFALRYQVLSNDGLAPYKKDFGDYSDDGWDKGNFEKKVGRDMISLNYTGGQDPENTDKTGFQVVQDSTSGTVGISLEGGTLITLYFVAPTKVGTYTFEVVWMDGCDNAKVQYDMTVASATATYTVECKSHVAGTPEVTKAADCENAGEKVTKCTACGAEMKKETIAKLGHDWDNGVVAENVKCGETADTTFTCKREDCGETKVEKGAVVNHDMVPDEENSKAPECDEDGVEATKCAREGCDHKETKTIAKLGHVMESDQGAGEAPTCTEDGKVVEKCTREGCDEVKETVIPKLGHDFSGEIVVITAPTADAEGKYTVACVNDDCNEVEERTAKKLATAVENEDAGISVKAEDNILPEDLTYELNDIAYDEATKKFSAVLTFASKLVNNNLSGAVEVALDVEGAANFTITTVDAQGNEVPVEFTLKNGVLTFNANLEGEYSITFAEAKSPATSDASNTVVFAVVALVAVAGLVVVGKKRFAL